MTYKMSRTKVGLLAIALVAGCQAAKPVVPRASVNAPAAGVLALVDDPDLLARELLRLTNAVARAESAVRELINGLEAEADDQVPLEFWADLRSEVDMEALSEALLAVYKRHLSPDEMRAAILFFETSVGQGVLQKLPSVYDDARRAGEALTLQWEARAAHKLWP